ncbi:SCG3 [Cervus elaphus hippelaphus]|uniref:SCG3 n=1 Tax=Cervus elaphus hippelaphus TaxID=46360 RepID=A0A212CUJ5_CEREH|nr:SCG3 [Cervus elaphus hippelaphus]
MGFLWTGTWIVVLVLHSSPIQAFPKPAGSQEGRTLFQGLPTAKMNGMAPKKLGLRQLTVWGVSWKTYQPNQV